MHLAEHAGSSDQHGGDAENRGEGSGPGVARAFQDRFDEIAAGRTQQPPELLADRPAGGVLPKHQARNRHDD